MVLIGRFSQPYSQYPVQTVFHWDLVCYVFFSNYLSFFGTLCVTFIGKTISQSFVGPRVLCFSVKLLEFCWNLIHYDFFQIIRALLGRHSLHLPVNYKGFVGTLCGKFFSQLLQFCWDPVHYIFLSTIRASWGLCAVHFFSTIIVLLGPLPSDGKHLQNSTGTTCVTFSCQTIRAFLGPCVSGVSLKLLELRCDLLCYIIYHTIGPLLGPCLLRFSVKL